MLILLPAAQAQNSLPANATPGSSIQVSFFSPTPFPGTAQSAPFSVVAQGIPPELTQRIDIFGNGFLIASCNASSCNATIDPAAISAPMYNVSAKGYATDGTYALSPVLSYAMNSSLPASGNASASNVSNATSPSGAITLPSSPSPASMFSAASLSPLYTPISPLPVRQYFDVGVNLSAVAPPGAIFNYIRSGRSQAGTASPQYMAGSQGSGMVYAYSENGTLLFSFNSSQVSSQSFTPLGFDIDGDGVDDFAIGYPVPSGSAPGSVVVYSGANGSTLYSFQARNSSFPYFGASVSSYVLPDNSSALLLAGSPYESNPANASATLFSTARYYLARVQINSTVQSDLRDFPARVVFDSTYPVRMGSLLANCSNLQVLAPDMSTQLYFDIENGTCNTNSTVAWVKIPLLKNFSVANIVYLYANQSAGGLWNASAVWSNGYVSVWHGGDLADSLGNNNLANSPYGTVSVSSLPGACAFGECFYTAGPTGALVNAGTPDIPLGNSTH
ncbi:MAG TPA: hypothetical protein PLO51_03865, partial [Candidatus Micrarchaeota archaeon]|nr:hypothetical protein [Candidatus Micrarchaeota archaeon]